MIVKELELTNIRSYEHAKVSFPAGRTLLEGDIGSGKSSILMGIEFALFGLGSEQGGSVLKLDRDAGEVRLAFEVEGSEYEVVRRLRRKSGRVQQENGSLKTQAETLDLSPSELKEKVLEVLEFNEAPDPKAQSWVYRYAVYTPQEEMKSILNLAPEQRLQILRRAFRVEDYKTAATNAEDAARQVRVDASRLAGIAEGAERLRRDSEDLRQREDRLREGLSGLERTESEAEARVQGLKARKEELQEREVALQERRARQSFYERMKAEADEDLSGLEEESRELKDDLARVEEALAGARMPSERMPPLAELKRRERALEGKVKKVAALKAVVEAKFSDYQSIMERGVCPVCDRPAEAHDFELKKSRKDAERKHLSEVLSSAEEELTAARARTEHAEELKTGKREQDQHRTDRARLKREIEKKDVRKGRIAKRGAFAEATLAQLRAEMGKLKEAVEKGREEAKALLQAEEGFRKARDELVQGKERLESAMRERARVMAEISAKDEAAKQERRLREKVLWLEDYFLPTVKMIEKSVLTSINQEFDSLFRRWFGMLVSEADKEVSVDGDFTPTVTQGGYEQDVRYLSGGERTSVALAYRLALNILAQRVSAGMSSNLLILDEPTDGFSREQLGNVREVLDEVACPQVILVSHDKELESFADQIFRVTKSDGVSTVEQPAVG